MAENKKTILGLQLGDVIKITDPVDESINNETFYINYIDNTKIRLINAHTLDLAVLKINDDMTLNEGTITIIRLLSRRETPSYARQHGLLPSVWVNIYFGGELPLTITGEITNLEEDMIEIKTYPTGDVIYLNFDYKGMPPNIPIEYIEIRDKIEPLKEDVELENPDELEEEEREEDDLFLNEDVIHENKIKNQLKDIILKADQIKFSDEVFNPIIQFVTVDKLKQRYSIDVQATDLLDDLLSTIPTIQRTAEILNNIHLTIERFKQLRELFSDFDEYGNVISKKIKSASWKPMLKYFENFDKNLFWILPVVKNIKKMYLRDDETETESSDIQLIQMREDLEKIKGLQQNYLSGSNNEQNKYDELYSDLNEFFTPFDINNPENVSDIIKEEIVRSDLNVVLDCLTNFYSSGFSDKYIKPFRFAIQKYNVGIEKLTATSFGGGKMVSTRTLLTQPDVLEIKSFITLPEPTIRFSRINLPGTSILDKANLNNTFLHYWKMLNSKTNIQNVFIDNIETDINFESDNFVNNIKHFSLNLSENARSVYTKNEVYSKFTSAIIPKTKILFNLIKKHINGKLSIVDVVSYLEPFLVYTDDLTYEQYRNIIMFINNKISGYNKMFVEKSRSMLSFKRVRSSKDYSSHAFSVSNMFYGKKDLSIVNENYDISTSSNTYTNSEQLKKIASIDNGKLLTYALSNESVHLLFASDISEIFEDNANVLNKTIKDDEKNNTCKNYIISKHYDTVEDVNADNGHDVYFDKKYDNTDYSLLNNYENQLNSMEPDVFFDFLTQKIKSTFKYNDTDAVYTANTLIDGYKKVLNGHYAILNFIPESDNNTLHYYVRTNNKWVLDNSANKNGVSESQNIMCNLQQKCISKDYKNTEKCESTDLSKTSIIKAMNDKINTEFDTLYELSKLEYETSMNLNFQYHNEIISVLKQIEMLQLLKYNNAQYTIGVKNEDGLNNIVSPYSKIRDMILGQSDFIKRQNYIVKFAKAFTRINYDIVSGPLGEPENDNWLYCVETNSKLLPSFIYNVAVKYLNDPDNYNVYIELLVKKIGTLSDDGDSWVDKHSGYVIKKIDYDIDEGYEEGFRVKSRDVLKEDNENPAENIINNTTQRKKYDSPETIMIYSIINTLSIELGINIDNETEFIMNNVLTIIKETLPKESTYTKYVKDMANKGKRVPTYQDLYSQKLLYSTMGMIIIAIQTAMPVIKTRKTFPGCVRSFSGFPFEGTGDYSSVQYISCIAYKIRSPYQPWNVLMRTNETTIFEKMKISIETDLLKLPTVTFKINEKVDYLLYNPETNIQADYNIVKWNTFLPPLINFQIKKVEDVSPQFKDKLIYDLKTGSTAQREKILIIDSKIIHFSLALQDKIHNVIKSKKLLLHSRSNLQYIENACCNETGFQSTIEYFENKDPSIRTLNNTIVNLTNILQDIRDIRRPVTFSTKINTKNVYSQIPNTFNEQTIYTAFIVFCRFVRGIPLSPELFQICSEKPNNLNTHDSLFEMIRKLKADGKIYTNDAFLKLIQLVNRQNIIITPYNGTITLSPIAQLSDLLVKIKNSTEANDLQKLILTVVDKMGDFNNDPSAELAVKTLNNFLRKKIDNMKEVVIDFIKKNANLTKAVLKKTEEFINTSSVWETNQSVRNQDLKLSDDGVYTVLNFFKTYIQNICITFPNIILNAVNYDMVKIQKYWDLSLKHEGDIKKLINEYYNDLKKHYNDKSLILVLRNIQQTAKNTVLLSQKIPCYTSINHNGKIINPIFNERTGLLLYEYLFLNSIVSYIDLSNMNDMIVREFRKGIDTEENYTIQSIMEKETRIDLVDIININDVSVIQGYKRNLKRKVADLLVTYIEIVNNHKSSINTSHDLIMDKIFKLKEKEKDTFTDRLKGLTDEERDIDTILKINKLGVWGKGLEKGLTMYDVDTYDEEREFGEKMSQYEKMLNRNPDVNNKNFDMYLEDYMNDEDVENDIENDNADMDNMTEDFTEGNYGSDEVDNYSDYY